MGLCLLVASPRLDDIEVIADLMRSLNSQSSLLRDLFQVITADPTLEKRDLSPDGDPDHLQFPVAARTQGFFDPLGQVSVFGSRHQVSGVRRRRIDRLSVALLRSKRGGLAHGQYTFSSEVTL